MGFYKAWKSIKFEDWGELGAQLRPKSETPGVVKVRPSITRTDCNKLITQYVIVYPKIEGKMNKAEYVIN